MSLPEEVRPSRGSEMPARRLPEPRCSTTCVLPPGGGGRKADIGITHGCRMFLIGTMCLGIVTLVACRPIDEVWAGSFAQPQPQPRPQHHIHHHNAKFSPLLTYGL